MSTKLIIKNCEKDATKYSWKIKRPKLKKSLLKKAKIVHRNWQKENCQIKAGGFFFGQDSGS